MDSFPHAYFSSFFTGDPPESSPGAANPDMIKTLTGEIYALPQDFPKCLIYLPPFGFDMPHDAT